MVTIFGPKLASEEGPFDFVGIVKQHFWRVAGVCTDDQTRYGVWSCHMMIELQYWLSSGAEQTTTTFAHGGARARGMGKEGHGGWATQLVYRHC